jgi:quercetin dioxygenase-like cupin family protein
VAEGFTIKHRDEFEVMEGSGNATWLLARKALGTDCFGYNLVEIAPGGRIPEHNHGDSGEVEVYVILEGDATMRLDGEDHRAPAGTFASIDSPTNRTIVNDSDGKVTALLIGVLPDGGYEPMSWG